MSEANEAFQGSFIFIAQGPYQKGDKGENCKGGGGASAQTYYDLYNMYS
jgi:hypothetical protein